jgi:hypothetical protein
MESSTVIEIDKSSQKEYQKKPQGSMTAARTEPVEFKTVGLNRKAVTGGHLFLETLDVAVFEFHNLSAAGADEVVVMTFMGHIVVLGLGAEVTGLCQAGFAEEIKRTVNRRQSQMGIFSRKLVVHRFRRDVLLFEKGIENHFTLARELQLVLAEMLFQHPYLLRVLRHSTGPASCRGGH